MGPTREQQHEKTGNMTGVLRLRPHHLVDIIRNIGHNRPLKPHPYGHAQHLITLEIMNGLQKEIMLVVKADDLCRPCMHLIKGEVCDDVLSQLEFPVRKQHYNDALDRKLLAFFGIQEGVIISLPDFISLIEDRFDELVPLCLHPKEDIGYRQEGLRKGLERLKEEHV